MSSADNERSASRGAINDVTEEARKSWTDISDGLTDEIITDLSQIWIRVFSRNSSTQLKGAATDLKVLASN